MSIRTIRTADDIWVTGGHLPIPAHLYEAFDAASRETVEQDEAAEAIRRYIETELAQVAEAKRTMNGRISYA